MLAVGMPTPTFALYFASIPSPVIIYARWWGVRRMLRLKEPSCDEGRHGGYVKCWMCMTVRTGGPAPIDG